MKNKSEHHIFFLLTTHDLLITKSILSNYLIDNNYVLYFFGKKNDIHVEWFGEAYNHIHFMENETLLSRFKFFTKINKEIKDNNNKDVFFYSSTYVNFISNYFLRNKNIKKILISHGISNYIIPKYDFSSRGYIQPTSLFKKLPLLYLHHLTSLKQFLQLLMCGRIYDFFYNHTCAHNKISFDKGYFFSLENLVTKTKEDIKVDIHTNQNDLKDDDYILFLEELHAPSKKNMIINDQIINYFNKHPSKTILYKPHPNMGGMNNSNRFSVKNKIIFLKSGIPAEYYIKKEKKITVIGSLSSTLIYTRLINSNNTAIYFDDQEDNISHSYILRKFGVNIIQFL